MGDLQAPEQLDARLKKFALDHCDRHARFQAMKHKTSMGLAMYRSRISASDSNTAVDGKHPAGMGEFSPSLMLPPAVAHPSESLVNKPHVDKTTLSRLPRRPLPSGPPSSSLGSALSLGGDAAKLPEGVTAASEPRSENGRTITRANQPIKQQVPESLILLRQEEKKRRRARQAQLEEDEKFSRYSAWKNREVGDPGRNIRSDESINTTSKSNRVRIGHRAIMTQGELKEWMTSVCKAYNKPPSRMVNLSPDMSESIHRGLKRGSRHSERDQTATSHNGYPGRKDQLSGRPYMNELQGNGFEQSVTYNNHDGDRGNTLGDPCNTADVAAFVLKTKRQVSQFRPKGLTIDDGISQHVHRTTEKELLARRFEAKGGDKDEISALDNRPKEGGNNAEDVKVDDRNHSSSAHSNSQQDGSNRHGNDEDPNPENITLTIKRGPRPLFSRAVDGVAYSFRAPGGYGKVWYHTKLRSTGMRVDPNSVPALPVTCSGRDVRVRSDVNNFKLPPGTHVTAMITNPDGSTTPATKGVPTWLLSNNESSNQSGNDAWIQRSPTYGNVPHRGRRWENMDNLVPRSNTLSIGLAAGDILDLPSDADEAAAIRKDPRKALNRILGAREAIEKENELVVSLQAKEVKTRQIIQTFAKEAEEKGDTPGFIGIRDEDYERAVKERKRRERKEKKAMELFMRKVRGEDLEEDENDAQTNATRAMTTIRGKAMKINASGANANVSDDSDVEDDEDEDEDDIIWNGLIGLPEPTPEERRARRREKNRLARMTRYQQRHGMPNSDEGEKKVRPPRVVALPRAYLIRQRGITLQEMGIDEARISHYISQRGTRAAYVVRKKKLRDMTMDREGGIEEGDETTEARKDDGPNGKASDALDAGDQGEDDDYSEVTDYYDDEIGDEDDDIFVPGSWSERLRRDREQEAQDETNAKGADKGSTMKQVSSTRGSASGGTIYSAESTSHRNPKRRILLNHGLFDGGKCDSEEDDAIEDSPLVQDDDSGIDLVGTPSLTQESYIHTYHPNQRVQDDEEEPSDDVLAELPTVRKPTVVFDDD